MEALIKKELGYSSLKSLGSGGGGCISQGQSYNADQTRIFVKINSKPKARLMFDGEAASLDAILQTGKIKVPKPIKVIDNPKGGALFIMGHEDMTSTSRYSSQLGEQLARLHLHNNELGQQSQSSSIHTGDADSKQEYISKFGFHVPTCCGYIPQDNTWTEDWETFFIRQKLQLQLDLIEKDYNDREARELWQQMLPRITKLFEGIEIQPALLHGDLWGGNADETDEGPIIFDPASFYGHHEYELGIMGLFGGFNSKFYKAYHSLIPKAPGFDKRHQLYQLFHYLNHWNHFGTGYRNSSIRIMREIAKI